MYVCLYIQVSKYAYVYVCTNASTHVCIYVCIMCVCMINCLYVCLYLQRVVMSGVFCPFPLADYRTSSAHVRHKRM